MLLVFQKTVSNLQSTAVLEVGLKQLRLMKPPRRRSMEFLSPVRAKHRRMIVGRAARVDQVEEDQSCPPESASVVLREGFRSPSMEGAAGRSWLAKMLHYPLMPTTSTKARWKVRVACLAS